jgi:glutamate-1-semialdehyde 2,1-aminomutase
MTEIPLTTGVVSAAVAAAAFYKGYQRIGLSRAKNPSLTGHSRMAKFIARLIPNVAYAAESWLAIDQAPAGLVQRRREGFEQLVADLAAMSPKTLAASESISSKISDVQFTRRYRVPPQFRNADVERIKLGNIWQSSSGVWLEDLDGQRYWDVSGCYGVNLFGLDFYKSTINKAVHEAQSLGPFLGGYHPCIDDVVSDLLAISGMDEVSFHMSGTEAVMQAVRLARYHTGRKRLVRFCGAYHGWWDDVQPGPGNPMPPSRHTLTLREMHHRTLRYLRSANDIACVLVNPIQAMHPNKAAPSDSVLLDGSRTVGFDKQAYSSWLAELREVCTDRGIVMIMDEVFLGFRLAPGGAQEYFGVKADLVTYGKTLGGGLPVGVLCGKKSLMRRFKEERPADICFARGTFNAHPYVLAAMHEFLQRLKQSEIRDLYASLDAVWLQRRQHLNNALAAAGAPLRFEGMATVWAAVFTQPSEFHWLLQFYMRREGIAMSWVGSGRLIFNLSVTSEEFHALTERIERAVVRFMADGWWSARPQGVTGREIRNRMLRQALMGRFKNA